MEIFRVYGPLNESDERIGWYREFDDAIHKSLSKKPRVTAYVSDPDDSILRSMANYSIPYMRHSLQIDDT